MDDLRTLDKIKLTSRDYEGLMSEALRLIERLCPNWKPSGLNDPGMMILAIACAIGDQLNYYLDTSAREAFIATVQQRKNAVDLFRGVGYTLSWYQSARAVVSFTAIHDHDITIPLHYPVASEASGAIAYFTTEEIIIPANTVDPVPVEAIQGTHLTEDIAFDSIQDNRIYLPYNNIDESYIRFFVDGEEWVKLDSLIDNYGAGKYFVFGIDEQELAYIELVPYWNLYIDENREMVVHCAVSIGASGRVAEGFLTRKGDLLRDSTGADVTYAVTVTNEASRGGKNPESIDSARLAAVKKALTTDTLVNLTDFEVAAESLETVGKSRAVDFDVVDSGITEPYKLNLYVASPDGTAYLEAGLTAIKTYLLSKKVAVRDITVLQGNYLAVDFDLTVHISVPKTNEVENRVKNAVLSRLKDYFDPSNREFGETVKMVPIIQDIMKNVPEVIYCVPTTSAPWEVQATLTQLPKLGTVAITVVSA